MKIVFSEAERDDAWKRFGQTQEGERAIQKLYSELTRLAPRPDDVGALREHEGRRKFARELIELMNADVESGRAGDSGRFLGPRREPVGLAVARGAARRVPDRSPYDDGA